MVKKLGARAGIVGAFLVALGFAAVGYGFFLASSVSLLYIAVKEKDRAYIELQAIFLIANLIGCYNYILKGF